MATQKTLYSLQKTTLVFKIKKSKCLLVGADRCETVGAKQEMWSESNTLIYLIFYRNSIFLFNFLTCETILTPPNFLDLFNVDFCARQL